MENYRSDVRKTESTSFTRLINNLTNPRILRLLHATIGIATESGELLDALKKHIWYDKPLDETNLIEELGDLFWYIEVAMDVLNVTEEEVKQRNIEKLKTRYPNQEFSTERAIERNLEKERKALDK